MSVVEGLTIAICTRNRPDDLKRCIKSIGNSAISCSENIEVIIIDDGDLAEPFIQEVAATLQPYMQFKYYKKNNPGLFLSRIEALSIAAHQIILFLDDDVEIDRNYCETLRETYRDLPEITGLGGIDVLFRKPSLVRRTFGYIFYFNSGNPGRRSLSQFGDSMMYWNQAEFCFETDFLSGCNMSFRKAALNQLAPVHWLQSYSLGEDTYLSYIARRQGKLYVNPKLKVWHHQAAIGRDKIGNVSYTEIINSYHLMDTAKASGWHYIVLLWSSFGKIISCVMRDNKAERLGGYIKGLSALLKLLVQKV